MGAELELETTPVTEDAPPDLEPGERGAKRVALKRLFARQQFGPQGIELGYMRYIKDAYAGKAGVLTEIYHTHQPGQRTARTVPILQILSRSGTASDVFADQGNGPRVRLWDVYVRPEDRITQDQILFSYVSEEDWVSFEACLRPVGLSWPEPEAEVLAKIQAVRRAEAARAQAAIPSAPDPREEEILVLKTELAKVEERTAEAAAQQARWEQQTRLDDFDLLSLAQKLLESIEARGDAKVVHYDLEALTKVFEAIVPVLERALEQPINRLYPILDEVKRGHVIGAAVDIYRVQLADLEAEEVDLGASESLEEAKRMVKRAMTDFINQTTGMFDG